MVYDGEKTVVVAFYVKCVRRYESMEGEYEENDPHAEERAQDVHLRMVIFFLSWLKKLNMSPKNILQEL